MATLDSSSDLHYVFVDSQAGLEQAALALSACPRLYLDTEFDSGRGPTRLCLLQISSGTEIFLIDTLKLSELGVLARALARPEVEWVLHAGLQDLELIQQRLHVRAPERLFDTQVAYALVSAENNVSLAYLCHRLLGAASKAGHQADDWLRRPLPESQLRYAAGDVQHLPALRDQLAQRADAKDRLPLVFEASHAALEPSREPAPPLSLESFRNAWQLGPRSQAGLRFLIEWHQQLSAEDKQGAPDTKTLLALAARMPESVDALARIKGASPAFVKRHGRQIVEGLREKARTAVSSDFVPIEPIPYATFAEIRYEAWLGLLRAEICAALEVSPDHVLPARVMRELKAKLQESRPVRLSDVLRGYRQRLLGSAIDAFCERQPPPTL
jgi:ribonuclease D